MCSPLKGFLLIVPLTLITPAPVTIERQVKISILSPQCAVCLRGMLHNTEIVSAVWRDNFMNEYLGTIETDFEKNLASLSGAQKKNGGRKSRDTLLFNLIPGCGVSPGKKKKSPIVTLLQYIATVYSPPLSVQKRIL